MMDEDLSAYIDGFKRRVAQDAAVLQQRLDAGRAEAGRLARLLIAEYGAQRVYLVGSLAHGRIHLNSDIDLAVEGLPAQLYWKAAVRLERETDLPVDLIDLDCIEQSVAERVKKEGVLIAD